MHLYTCGRLPPTHFKLEFGKRFRDLGKHSNVIHGRKCESDSLSSLFGERRTNRTEILGHNERQLCCSSCWALWVEGHTSASMWLSSVGTELWAGWAHWLGEQHYLGSSLSPFAFCILLISPTCPLIGKDTSKEGIEMLLHLLLFNPKVKVCLVREENSTGWN